VEIAGDRAAAPLENLHRIGNSERELSAGAEWLRQQLALAGRHRVVIGLSGGIDSAVVALWAARALGAPAVTVVAMPYGLLAPAAFAPSAKESLRDARLVAERLPGADYRDLDIAPTVDAEAASTGLLAELRETPEAPLLRLALANLKARIRAVRLRYYANRLDALLLGTENKSEHYLGYFTIGGDEESDLELLSNYFKAEVRKLAVALGAPAELVAKAPSADLWSGQTDETELGFTYQEADQVLHLTGCSPDMSDDAAARCRVDRAVAARVLDRVRATAFKRAPKPIFPRPPVA
jgi:NAD+ synthase